MDTGRRSRKSEIRSSKSETNPNCQEWGNGETGIRDVSLQAESNLDYSSAVLGCRLLGTEGRQQKDGGPATRGAGEAWDFMIVLQDGSLPTVWEEIEGLQKLEPAPTWTQNWGDRRQRFQWFKRG